MPGSAASRCVRPFLCLWHFQPRQKHLSPWRLRPTAISTADLDLHPCRHPSAHSPASRHFHPRWGSIRLDTLLQRAKARQRAMPYRQVEKRLPHSRKGAVSSGGASQNRELPHLTGRARLGQPDRCTSTQGADDMHARRRHAMVQANEGYWPMRVCRISTLYRPLALCLMLCGAQSAQAQCRIGSGPDFGDGIPYCSELEPETPYEPYQPYNQSGYPDDLPPNLPSLWGAIAIDPEAAHGGVGVAAYMTSEALAEARALKNCRETGGSETCRIQFTYANQCAAIASGESSLSVAKATTQKSASELALDSCGERTTNCKIVYANCS